MSSTQNQSSAKEATIVGAGLVGCLWAILMAKRGYQLRVYERRPDMRQAAYVGGRSINLALSHRGWRALELAGIAEAIRQVGLPMYGRMIHSKDQTLTEQAYGKAGEAIYSVSRGGLNLALLELADSMENVQFYFEHRCDKVDLELGELHFTHLTTQQTLSANSDRIFGTDGAFSAVREAMFKRGRFNYQQYYLPDGYKELTIPALPDGGYRMAKNVLHIWPRGRFMLIALPNLDGSFTCTLFLPFEGEHSFEALTDDSSVQAFFKEFFPDTLPLMPNLLEEFEHNPTSSLVTVKCSPWHAGKGLLMGDASHAIVPFYGQGMNSGFEDCMVLWELMEEMGEDRDKLFPAFGNSRHRDTDAIAELAFMNYIEMRDRVGDPRFLLRKKIEAALYERYPEHFIPLYSMVTFSHLPYSQALAESHRQDALFNRILEIEGVEHDITQPAVLQLFEAEYLPKY